eukprot:SAG22_NODE_1713_length_3750_cov_1.552177_3_plen_99_part_00
MPNLYTFRPGDGNEVAGSYAAALELTHSPSVLACSRTGMPVQAGTSIDRVKFGAYLLNIDRYVVCAIAVAAPRPLRCCRPACTACPPACLPALPLSFR